MLQAMNFTGVYEIFTGVYEKQTPLPDQSDYSICYNYDLMCDKEHVYIICPLQTSNSNCFGKLPIVICTDF